ncbi:MAG TPA: PilZ domain-containing protein [Candidatus Limnocylindrales bacterium]|nr:PilZ domain-containing protein [Candidatus Limnocylindrales bacterium]
MTVIERRRYARYECHVAVEVRIADGPESYPGTLADICLGGCYVSTVSPLPPGTVVELLVKTPEKSAAIAGRTVTCLPGSGMGIEFTAAANDQQANSVRSLIDLLEGGSEKSAGAAV